jgi:hypothetical protein
MIASIDTNTEIDWQGPGWYVEVSHFTYDSGEWIRWHPCAADDDGAVYFENVPTPEEYAKETK